MRPCAAEGASRTAHFPQPGLAGEIDDVGTGFADLRGKQVRGDETLSHIIPIRNPKVIGNLDVYYYDYLKDHLETVPTVKLDGTLAYEALNLVDGRRSVTQIHNTLRAAYGAVAPQDLLDYFKLLEKAGVVTIRGLP